MAGPQKARAVVLSSRPLGEADRIVRLFTRELGRVDAVVKGVRKTTSRWGGRLEPFNVCDLLLHPGRSLYTVTQAQLVDVFMHLRMDREGLTAAAIVCEAAAGVTPEHEPEERVFALLRNTLRELDRGHLRARRRVAAGARRAAQAALRGRLPAGAGRSARPAARAAAPSASRPRAAASSAPTASARACRSRPRPSRRCSTASRLPLAELREQPASAAVGEALRDVHQLYAYHTGSRLRALRIAGAGLSLAGAAGSAGPQSSAGALPEAEQTAEARACRAGARVAGDPLSGPRRVAVAPP